LKQHGKLRRVKNNGRIHLKDRDRFIYAKR